MSKYVDDLPISNIPSNHSTAQIVAGGVAKAVIASLLVLMVMGCNVGPNYKRPVATTPQSYRGALAPEVAIAASAESSLGDQRGRAILKAMRADEQRHGEEAGAAGAQELPAPVRGIMRQVAKIMKRGAYRL